MAVKKPERHPIDPVYDENSRILILGSFPSVKSREQGFFYGHPRNRFWKVLARLFDCEVPQSVEQKKQLLLKNGIAVWDVIASCSIAGSSDSSISDVVVNDFSDILSKTGINRIYVNGTTAEKYYRKYAQGKTGIKAIRLPSTSPANASMDLEKLVEVWEQLINKTE